MKIENGYYVWTKGEESNELLSPHFKAGEFECRCRDCDSSPQRISVALVEGLENVRSELTRPLTITSGYRCADHQHNLKELGYPTAKGISEHEKGNAADVTCAAGMKRLAPILQHYFKAVGIALTFGHIDVRTDKVRLWVYSV